MRWSAPSWRARSSLSSDDEARITVAPLALANCSAKMLTPPVPSSTTTEPGRVDAGRTAFHAVVAAIGSAAPCTKSRCGGSGTRLAAGTATYSASDPGSVTPRKAATWPGVMAPPSQPGMKCGTTRSPTATLVTPSPSAATSPAPSATGTMGNPATGNPPVAMATSRKLSEAALRRTTTSPRAGSGSGSSLALKAVSEGAVSWMAFMGDRS